MKLKLIGVIVVLLGVTFLGDAVEWDGSFSLMHEGIGIGAVLLALGWIVWLSKKDEGAHMVEDHVEDVATPEDLH